MSTAPVSTVSVPSGFSRIEALVGWMPGTHPPTARPVPRSCPVLAPLAFHSSRVFQSGCSMQRFEALAGAVDLPGLAVRHQVAAPLAGA